MSKLTSAEIYNIGTQDDADSYPLRENFENLKNAHNNTDTRVDNIVSTGTIVEVSDSRPYHTVLKNRLDSDWNGQCNYIKNGGICTVSSTGNTVNVTAGQAKVNGIDVKWDASVSASVSLASASTRLDVVVVNSDSTLSIVAGTESADYVFPNIAVTQKPLYYLTVSTTAVTATDCRDQGCLYWDEGRWKYSWKIQSAIDDITSGEVFIKKGIYYEEVDLSGKNYVALRFEDGAKIYRISDTNYCIKSVNTSGNETTGIKVIGADLYGNGKAGSLCLAIFDYTDDCNLWDWKMDANSSSTANAKRLQITNCDRMYQNGKLTYNDLTISDATTLYQGKYNCHNLIITNSITVDCTSTTGIYNLQRQNIIIKCTGDFITDSNGDFSITSPHLVTSNGIKDNGDDGADNAGGGGGSGGGSIVSAGGNGGDGGAGTGIASSGGTGGSGFSTSIQVVSFTPANGGNGGDGAGASEGAGGSGGDLSSFLVIKAKNINIGANMNYNGGNGANGANGQGAASEGGGGGAGGSGGGIICFIADENITINTGVTISCNGGNGGNGGNASGGNSGGGGGGGAGAGGLVLIRSKSYTNLGTISITAGSVGTGGTKEGTGTAGSNGSAGTVGILDQADYTNLTDITDSILPLNIYGLDI